MAAQQIPGIKTKKITPEEEAFIREHHATKTRAWMAKQLGRTKGGVGRWMRRRGLKSPLGRVVWTKEKVRELTVLSEEYGCREISRIMGLSRACVANKMSTLGIRSNSGVYSLAGASKFTGYNTYQLLRAKKALRQKWQLIDFSTPDKGRCSRYVISFEQLEALCEYLKNEK